MVAAATMNGTPTTIITAAMAEAGDTSSGLRPVLVVNPLDGVDTCI